MADIRKVTETIQHHKDVKRRVTRYKRIKKKITNYKDALYYKEIIEKARQAYEQQTTPAPGAADEEFFPDPY